MNTEIAARLKSRDKFKHVSPSRELSILLLLPFLWTLMLPRTLIPHKAWTVSLKLVVSNRGGWE